MGLFGNKKGFKVVGHDSVCNGHKFTVGTISKLDGKAILCQHGYHFCSSLKKCNFYVCWMDNPWGYRYLEVEAIGDLASDKQVNGNSKYCTTQLYIKREVPVEEACGMAGIRVPAKPTPTPPVQPYKSHVPPQPSPGTIPGPPVYLPPVQTAQPAPPTITQPTTTTYTPLVQSAQPVYTPPAQPAVYTPPAQPVVYTPPTQPAQSTVYTPPAQSTVYTPPAQPAVYTLPKVTYGSTTNPQVFRERVIKYGTPTSF